MRSRQVGQGEVNHGKVGGKVQRPGEWPPPKIEEEGDKIVHITPLSPEVIEQFRNARGISSEELYGMRPKAFIFDLDSTLRRDEARLVHIVENDWGKYYDNQVNDPPVQATVDILNALGIAGYKIIILTGSKRANLIIQWLDKYHIQYDKLFYREDSDDTKDTNFKEDIYWSEIVPHYDVVGVFEDRERVVNMWESVGVTCLQPRYNQETRF